jgi:hypothetical protein
VSSSDEELAGRLRDLALVDLDALGARLVPSFADDVADALREARTRIAALRAGLAADHLAVVEARRGDTGVSARLFSQAEAARALARLAELAAPLVGKLFEADRRYPKNP